MGHPCRGESSPLLNDRNDMDAAAPHLAGIPRSDTTFLGEEGSDFSKLVPTQPTPLGHGPPPWFSLFFPPNWGGGGSILPVMSPEPGQHCLVAVSPDSQQVPHLAHLLDQLRVIGQDFIDAANPVENCGVVFSEALANFAEGQAGVLP